MLHLMAGGSEQPLPLQSGAKAQAILDHLSTGCVECVEALELLQKVRNENRHVERCSPPDYAVDSAKEAFAPGVTMLHSAPRLRPVPAPEAVEPEEQAR